VRICDLLLKPLLSRARVVDRLDEAVERLRVQLAAQWEMDVEVSALWTLVTRV
jgi:hypothetical protein